jgi:hypothetical protein
MRWRFRFIRIQVWVIEVFQRSRDKGSSQSFAPSQVPVVFLFVVEAMRVMLAIRRKERRFALSPGLEGRQWDLRTKQSQA